MKFSGGKSDKSGDGKSGSLSKKKGTKKYHHHGKGKEHEGEHKHPILQLVYHNLVGSYRHKNSLVAKNMILIIQMRKLILCVALIFLHPFQALIVINVVNAMKMFTTINYRPLRKNNKKEILCDIFVLLLSLSFFIYYYHKSFT